MKTLVPLRDRSGYALDLHVHSDSSGGYVRTSGEGDHVHHVESKLVISVQANMHAHLEGHAQTCIYMYAAVVIEMCVHVCMHNICTCMHYNAHTCMIIVETSLRAPAAGLDSTW